MSTPSQAPLTPSDQHDRTAAAAVDVAGYLAFSRTWQEWWKGSGLPYGQVEARMRRLMRQVCRWVDPTLILEIGAHEARFSQRMAELFPDVPVVAFEANPYVYDKYAERLGDTAVDYRNAAVGPVTGEITLQVPTLMRGARKRLANAMASIGRHRAVEESIEVRVPCVRLDDEFSLTANDRVVAWVDVEGANGPVLQSGRDVLSRLQVLHIEVESQTTWEDQWLDTDVAAHLKAAGMVPLARDIQRRSHQYNVAYVRAELINDPRFPRRAATMLRGGSKAANG